jgi:hypothetical protein
MEKSKIVHQLLLPQDAVDYICSFVFYSVAESTKRKREMYSNVVRQYKRVRREELMTWGPNVISSYTVYFILPRSNQLVLACMCCTCGNYRKPSYYPLKKIVCQCI